jgi:hypothetical protein
MKKEYWIFIVILAVIAIGAYAFGQYSSGTSGIVSPSAARSEQSAAASAGTQENSGTFQYTDASAHIGEYATIEGAPIDVYTSKKGTVFFDYCKEYDSCPFSAVIFSSDASKFGDLSSYQGKTIRVTGTISSYQSRAEIIIKDPSQIEK